MTLLRAWIKIVFCVVLTLIMVPLQLLYACVLGLFGFKPRNQSPLVRIWYQGMTWILGLRVRYDGHPLKPNQHYLYVGNHISYLDIMVLGTLFPPFFIAKSDMADWPIFGFLVKLGGTIFISRKRSLVKQQMDLLKREMKTGKNLLLFPEGTTSNGREVLRFKSSLLNILYDADMPKVQIAPFSIQYTQLNGTDFPDNKDIVAWYADMELLPHLWVVFQQRSINVVVHLLEPMDIASYDDAKKLTAECEKRVRQSFMLDAPAQPDTTAE